MKKKKRLKIWVWVLIGVILIPIFGFGGYYFYHLKSIEHKYSKYASVYRKADLYNEKKQVVGVIYKNYPVELQEKSNNKGYFKVKDTDYYVYYNVIQKEKEIKNDSLKENQLSLNKGIKSIKKTTLYKSNEKVLDLSIIDFKVAYEDKDQYYVFFQNQLLEIKKDKDIEEYEIKDETLKKANHISVLYYERVLDSCGDSNCTTTTQFKSQMDALIKNDYYFIDRDEFDQYLDGFIQLKDKAIFITTSNLTESLMAIAKEYKIPINDVSKEYDIHYYSNNKPSYFNINKQYTNRYQVKQNTSTETVLKMAQGEVIEIIQDRQAIPVLNYHFFYDPTGKDFADPNSYERCDEVICLDVAKFRQHLDYLKENHYQVLTITDFRRWMYGEIELPTKSVLITVDDGARGTGKHNGNKLIPLLEEYKMPATLFLITGWWNFENYLSPYLAIQSHTNNMHQYGSCGRGQMNCTTYDEVMKDLKLSLNSVTNDDSFCFPFYMYSETSLRAVKDTGFKIAFVGGNRKATRQNNKFLIPRYPIQSDITLDEFIRIVN